MSDRNERVRALLREGDPAAGEPGLSLEEIQAMRRVVLTAAPANGRRRWLVPILATAATLILAVMIAFSLWRPGTVETAARPSPPLPPSPTSPTPSLGEGGTVTERVVVPLSRGGERGGGRGVRGEGLHQPAPAPPVPEPPAPEPVIAEGPQQIQFATPGGTRVIWMLNPATD